MSRSQAENPGRLVGYCRVSTTGQSLSAQLDTLKAKGCDPIFREKQSGGSTTERRELAKMLASLKPGDQVIVTAIDRLARSIFDLFAIVKRIADAGATFVSIREPWADTGSSTGRLMLAVLGGLADVERDLIKSRTAEGRSRAVDRGVKMGRPSKLTPDQRREALARRANGESSSEIARSYAVAASTISRMK